MYNFIRQVRQLDDRVGCYIYSAFYDVLQFSYIPGPMIGEEGAYTFRMETGNLFLRFLTIDFEKMHGKGQNVCGMPAQRRKSDIEHI